MVRPEGAGQIPSDQSARVPKLSLWWEAVRKREVDPESSPG